MATILLVNALSDTVLYAGGRYYFLVLA
jgi:hypothetical protein